MRAQSLNLSASLGNPPAAAPSRGKTLHRAHSSGKHRLINDFLCAHCPSHCVTHALILLAYLLLPLCHRHSDSHSEVPQCQTAMIFRSSKRPPPGVRACFRSPWFCSALPFLPARCSPAANLASLFRSSTSCGLRRSVTFCWLCMPLPSAGLPHAAG
ncbi:Uncharacterised protein [Raoultella ornithinolytica]|nr:Uncharacterised protein [Raoultella ornithinolytica]